MGWRVETSKANALTSWADLRLCMDVAWEGGINAVWYRPRVLEEFYILDPEPFS